MIELRPEVPTSPSRRVIDRGSGRNNSVRSIRSHVSNTFGFNSLGTISLKGLFPRHTFTKPRVVPGAGQRSGSRAEAPCGDALPPAPTTASELLSYSVVFSADGLRRAFPLFYNREHYVEYRSWQRRTVMLEVMVAMIATIGVPNMFTRYSWQWFGISTETPWHLFAQLILFPLNLLFIVQITSHVFVLVYPDELSEEDHLRMELRGHTPHRSLSDWGLWMRGWSLWIVDRQAAVEDWFTFAVILCNTAAFVARVDYGACPAGWDTNVWLSQICNPVVACHSFPHDAVLMMYLPPMMIQLVWRSVSVKVMLVGYAIAIAAVAWAMHVVDGAPQMYTLIYIAAPILMTVEVERLLRVMFVQAMLNIESKQQLATLKAKELLLLSNQKEQELDREKEKSKVAALKRQQEELLEMEARKRVNEKLLAEKEQEQLRSIMGNVAHDLKTPLHSFAADVDHIHTLIQDAYKECVALNPTGAQAAEIFSRLMEKTEECFTSLEGNKRFLLMAINRTQDYVQASSGVALTPKLETVAIQDTLNTVTRIMANQNNGRVLTVRPLGPDMCPHQITDEHYLMENLLCLMSNASKYSDRGATIDVVVTFVAATGTTDAAPAMSGRMVEYSVADTGIGIVDAKKKLLFNAFSQAQRSAGGTGLGLFALAKRMEVLGGTCGVRDRDDGQQGSVFWFRMPYRPDLVTVAAAIDPCVALGRPLQLERSVLPPLRFLLADDTPSVVKMTTRFLTSAGHSVISVENGNQSLLRLKANRQEFDILLTDIQMPVMDGPESVQRYRAWEAEQRAAGTLTLPPLVIIGMSAKTDPIAVQEGLASGMDLYVGKPFTYAYLVSSLKSLDERVQRGLRGLSGATGAAAVVEESKV